MVAATWSSLYVSSGGRWANTRNALGGAAGSCHHCPSQQHGINPAACSRQVNGHSDHDKYTCLTLDRTQNNSAMVPGGSGGGEDESDDDEEEEEEEEEGEEESDEEPTSPARTTASAVSNNHPSVGARTGQNRRQDSGIDTTQLGRLSISPSHAPGWTPRIQAVSTHAAPLSYRSTYNPATASPSYHPRSPPLDPYRSLQFYHDPGIGSSTQAGASHNNRSNVSNLPVDIQAQLKALERRYIRTDPSTNNEEHLDPRKSLTCCPRTQTLTVAEVTAELSYHLIQYFLSLAV